MEVAAELWVLSLATPWQPLESRSPSKLKRMALQGERPGRGQSGTRTLVLKEGPGWTFTRQKAHEKWPCRFLSNGRIRNQCPKHTWTIRAGPTHVGFTTIVDVGSEVEPARQRRLGFKTDAWGPRQYTCLGGEGRQGLPKQCHCRSSSPCF